MFIETLPDGTQRHLAEIGRDPFFSSFYLAGGSAIALYLGHRRSVDLDFFTNKNFRHESIKRRLEKMDKLEIDLFDADTFLGFLGETKVSFFRLDSRLLFPHEVFSGAKIANLKDLALMKTDAVSRRGTKRDFIDLYFILQEKAITIEEIFNLLKTRYYPADYNLIHALTSLAYFDDAENEPMPLMFKEVDWEKVKAYFQRQSQILFKSGLIS